MIVLKTLAAKYRFRSLVLLAIVSFGVSSVAGIPLSEYHDKIDESVEKIKTLLHRRGDETDADYDTRFTETINELKARIPQTEQVEADQLKWNTDNSWFHAALDDLQRAPAAERIGKIESLLDAFRAVDERVAELENAELADGTEAAAKEKLESILSRPEYAATPQGPNALTRLIQDFIRWFRSLFPDAPQLEPGRASRISRGVQIFIVVAAMLVIAYVVRLLFIRFKRPGGRVKVRKKREARIVLGERLKPEDTATDLLAEAEALARNGDMRSAIRKGYIALLVELGDRNVISLAQYKTNRDYLRSVSNRPQLYSPLTKLTESFERHWYGYAQATPNDWQDFRAGYREALQTGN